MSPLSPTTILPPTSPTLTCYARTRLTIPARPPRSDATRHYPSLLFFGSYYFPFLSGFWMPAARTHAWAAWLNTSHGSPSSARMGRGPLRVCTTPRLNFVWLPVSGLGFWCSFSCVSCRAEWMVELNGVRVQGHTQGLAACESASLELSNQACVHYRLSRRSIPSSDVHVGVFNDNELWVHAVLWSSFPL